MTADRALVAGCRVDRLSMAQTVARCEELIGTPGVAQHVAINAAKVVSMQDDPALREIVSRCEIVSADGQSIVWASRILGDPLPARVAGIDLMQELLGLAERQGHRVYFLGARQEVLDRALERIRQRHPELRIAGARDGYFSDDEADAVAEAVRAAAPDILFVAMSSPRKEYWLSRYGRQIDVPFVMGVGGSVDVLAGVTRRAPEVLQRMGLEWAYRLAQEPRRLLRRYVESNARFGWLVLSRPDQTPAQAVRRGLRLLLTVAAGVLVTLLLGAFLLSLSTRYTERPLAYQGRPGDPVSPSWTRPCWQPLLRGGTTCCMRARQDLLTRGGRPRSYRETLPPPPRMGGAWPGPPRVAGVA